MDSSAAKTEEGTRRVRTNSTAAQRRMRFLSGGWRRNYSPIGMQVCTVSGCQPKTCARRSSSKPADPNPLGRAFLRALLCDGQGEPTHTLMSRTWLEGDDYLRASLGRARRICPL